MSEPVLSAPSSEAAADAATTASGSESGVRIYDTPVLSLPEDLYIPPQAFAIWLEQFAGPLDFLLYLVKKNNFDLTETAILPITEQYLSYIRELDETYFELAGDYLLMASTLIVIKSELLLPQHDITDDEASPKARLIQRLEEYAQIKTATERIDKLLRLERDVFLAYASFPSAEAMQRELPNYSPQLLVNSLVNMQIRPDISMHTVKADPVQLPERIASITRVLSEKGVANFGELIDMSQGKIGIVVSFVAVLELIKRGFIGFETPEIEIVEDAPEYMSGTHKGKKTALSPISHNYGRDLSTQSLHWLH